MHGQYKLHTGHIRVTVRVRVKSLCQYLYFVNTVAIVNCFIKET